MHELSIADNVMKSVVSVAKDNNVLSVKDIYLVVGTSSAVIEESLLAAFDGLKLTDEYSLCKNAKIHVKIVESKSICLDCGNEYTHGIGAAQCPYCKSFKTQLIEGSDVYIDKIEVENKD